MDAQGIELFCRFASGLGSRSARDSSPSVLLGRCGSLMEAGVAIRIGFRSGGSRNGVSADVSLFESCSLQRRVECEPDLAPWNRSPRSVPWPVFRRHALDPADVW